MSLPPLIKVGYIKKTFGYQGEVSIHVKEDFIDVLDETNFLFLSIDGYHVPYSIEHLQEKTDILIKFEDINSSEEAQRLVGSDILIEEARFTEEELQTFYTQGNIVGFDVASDGQIVGKIIQIDELPSQLLAHVKNEEKTYLIPIVQDFIHKIDSKSKIIYLTLPDGILSL